MHHPLLICFHSCITAAKTTLNKLTSTQIHELFSFLQNRENNSFEYVSVHDLYLVHQPADTTMTKVHVLGMELIRPRWICIFNWSHNTQCWHLTSSKVYGDSQPIMCKLNRYSFSKVKKEKVEKSVLHIKDLSANLKKGLYKTLVPHPPLVLQQCNTHQAQATGFSEWSNLKYMNLKDHWMPILTHKFGLWSLSGRVSENCTFWTIPLEFHCLYDDQTHGSSLLKELALGISSSQLQASENKYHFQLQLQQHLCNDRLGCTRKKNFKIWKRKDLREAKVGIMRSFLQKKKEKKCLSRIRTRSITGK